ncbi:MAG: hypothetical protein RL264_2454 [Bacteroidota bacterium]
MTKTDFFKIILKVLGIYLILLFAVSFIQIGVSYYYDRSEFSKFFMIFLLLLAIVIVYVMVLKPILIIRLFRLDKGFESDDISLTFNDGKGLIKIALTCTAIYLIASNLGDFLTELFFWFKSSIPKNKLETVLSTFDAYQVNYVKLISSGVQILTGFLFLFNANAISTWVENLNQKKKL